MSRKPICPSVHAMIDGLLMAEQHIGHNYSVVEWKTCKPPGTPTDVAVARGPDTRPSIQTGAVM